MKHPDLRNMLKKAFKSVRTSTVWHLLSPCSYAINFFSCGVYDSEPADEGYIQIAYLSD
jgi:hypothetical protein